MSEYDQIKDFLLKKSFIYVSKSKIVDKYIFLEQSSVYKHVYVVKGFSSLYRDSCTENLNYTCYILKTDLGLILKVNPKSLTKKRMFFVRK